LNKPDDCLSYKVRFHPMKPFKCTIDFVVKRLKGGVWKYKLCLEATIPNVDDIIVLSAALHKTASVSFRLTNRQKNFANF